MPTRFWSDVGQPFRKWFSLGWMRRLLLAAVSAALLALILSAHVLPERLRIAEGEIAPRDVPAPYEVENTVRTEELRRRAEEQVGEVMAVDPAVVGRARADVRSLFAEVRRVREGVRPAAQDGKGPPAPATAADPRADLAQILPGMPETVLGAVLGASDDVLRAVEDQVLAQLDRILTAPVRPDDLERIKGETDREWAPQGVQDRNLVFLARELVKAQVRPNLVKDEAATAEARARARESVQPVMIRRGQLIVRQGDVVTHEQYVMLEKAGLVGPGWGARKLAGVTLFAALVVGLMALYLWRARPDIVARESRLVLIALIGLVTVAVSLLVRSMSGYLMPLATGSMLLTVLLDSRVSLVGAALMTLAIGLVAQTETPVALAAAAGALAGVHAVRRPATRSDLILGGLLVGAVQFLAVLALHLVVEGSILEVQVWLRAFLALVGGLLAAVLAAGSLPILEGAFGILTPFKLLELANPNHPLLKKLLVEAPGTYHHTILVANLCEAGAEAIGADPMLARVGAYYHDVGKARRPYFFTENQFAGENPHDHLPPHVSALIIASHVKDGVEMAREHRVPPEIVDFIREHHGDMLISYFYHKAARDGVGEQVVEEDFRYEGPRPRSRETAICMLADGCEASVRALRQKGPLTMEQIEAQVRRIIRDRLEQGQLDRSDLTLRDLDTLARTFARVLGGVHHARVEYPALAGEMGSRVAGGPGEENQVEDLGRERIGDTRADTGAPDAGGAGGAGDAPRRRAEAGG